MKAEKYTLIKSDSYLCFATCLEMILKSEGYDEYDRYSIANFFGLVLPAEIDLSRYEKIENKSIGFDQSSFGVRIDDGRINQFFSSLDLPFVEHYLPISNFDEYSFEQEMAKQHAHHILVGYDFNRLYKGEGIARHISILAELQNSSVKIVNPGPLEFGVIKARIEDLFFAIRGISDGVSIVRRIDR